MSLAAAKTINVISAQAAVAIRSGWYFHIKRIAKNDTFSQCKKMFHTRLPFKRHVRRRRASQLTVEL